MRCGKCGGLMNFEKFTNISEDGFSWEYEGWRCLSCGEVLDPIILMNRAETRTPLRRVVAGFGAEHLRKKAA